MKNSELIKKLAAVQAVHGNVDVLIEDPNDANDLLDCGSIETTEDERSKTVAVISADGDDDEGETQQEGEVISASFKKLA